MKRFLVSLLIMAVSLVGCGNSGISQEEYDKVVTERDEYKEKYEQIFDDKEQTEKIKQESNSKKESENLSKNKESNIEVVEEYFYIRGGDKARYFLVVKNISDKTISVDINVIAKDGEDNILGAENERLNAIAPNQEMVESFYFDDAGAAENFEYTLNAEESEYTESYIDGITYEVSINKNKLIILITNNGEKDIDNVMPYALFFNDGEIFSHEYSGYVEVKAGSTVPVELECFDGEFEDFQLYISAWGDK